MYSGPDVASGFKITGVADLKAKDKQHAIDRLTSEVEVLKNKRKRARRGGTFLKPHWRMRSATMSVCVLLVPSNKK